MKDERGEILKELRGIVGKDYVSIDKEDILPYCRDPISVALKTYNGDYVVMPATTEEVQGVVRLANKFKIPVYPFGLGSTVSNAASPRAGGIILAMRRMRRVLEINEQNRTATFEAGVSWSHLIYETNKKRLEPQPLGGGPHSGTPVGNYLVGGYQTGAIDSNEVIALEVVLPDGELLRTGSGGYITHEKLNPYCRLAFGAPLTYLFRGSLGIYGVVTQMILRLYALRKIEERLQIGFDDLTSCLNGMQALVNLDICRQVYGLNRTQIATIAADIELLNNPEEYEKYEASFPAYVICAKISCHNEEQAKVYRDLIQEAISKDKGVFLQYTGSTQKTLDDLWNGSSRAAIHYLRHNPHLMAFTYSRPSLIPKIQEKTLEILEKHDYKMTSFSGKPLKEARVWIHPAERNENYAFEQEIEFDPMEPDQSAKFRQILGTFFDEVIKLGASEVNPAILRRLEPQMMPTYIKLLKDIKRSLDPNSIMAPRQVFKEM